jgi:dienelactone hydrolase
VKRVLVVAWLAIAPIAVAQPAPTAPGTLKGSAVAHTASSRTEAIANANIALPAAATGGSIWFGKWRDAPRTVQARVPVVVFLHGSSGLGLKAIEDWQRWLAGLGVASVAPDSFALADRLTYTSPVGKDIYEQIHALRASEIALATAALREVPWADASRMVLAGTSEGATAVARHGGDEFAGRVIYAWSCEDNYFVDAHRTAATPDRPVLNVISTVDPFFSKANGYLGNATASGHCGAAFAGNRNTAVVLVPGAPHTLIGLPAARYATAGFVREVLQR